MLQVHLHAGHFTLQDKETQHSYGGPLQGLLDHLGTRSLPAALAQSLLLSGRASGSSEGTSSNAGTGGSLANANLYDNGALRVTVTDHRLSPAAVYVVSLGPSPASLHADLKGLLGLSAGGRYSTATTDSLDDASGKMLQLEAELYPLLEPGLDLEPDIAVTQRANTARYNALKYQQTPRRGRRALAAQESSAITMSGNANSGGKRKRGAARVELDDEVERQTAKELNEWMTLLSPVILIYVAWCALVEFLVSPVGQTEKRILSAFPAPLLHARLEAEEESGRCRVSRPSNHK